ncbi:MAG: preprotein translocase subunit YajC [Parachlamydiaceae bacterium]|nr:preprotein translocase subunit YajC [Parachlamydiaceae bacterium]
MKTRLNILFTAIFFAVNGQLLAQAEESAPPSDQGFWQTLIMLGIFIVFFYLILWRPEQKRRKALEQQRDSLKKGDRVVAMGIIGNVVRVSDTTVILKMYDGTKLEFLRGAITDVMPPEEGEKKADINTADE